MAARTNRHVTHHPSLEAIRLRREALHKVRQDLESTVKVHEIKRFREAGGCQKCGGRGWVVVWDTLDCLQGSHAEYGTCDAPGCTSESRARSGLDRSYYSKYDRNSGLPKHDLRNQLVEELDRELARLLARSEELTKLLDPAVKGRRVRVVAGRKVPVGTEGTVFWIGEGKTPYAGLRLGVKVGPAREDVVWVAADNCLAVLQAP